jgi:hypothetical protein
VPLLWPITPPGVGYVEALVIGASLSLAMCALGWGGVILVSRGRG